MTAELDQVVVIKADGNNNVRLALPVGAFEAAEVLPSAHPEVVEPSGLPGHLEVTVGAAGSRYLADLTGLPPKPREWPEEIDGIAKVVAEAVPFTTIRVRGERANGQNRRVAIYSGDLARGQGDSVDEVYSKFGGSSAPSTANRDGSTSAHTKAEVLADHPMLDRILDVTARFVALVVPHPVSTVGETWGVTSPSETVVIRVNCGWQEVLWCRSRNDALEWGLSVPAGVDEADARRVASHLGTAIADGYRYKGPPANVGIEIGDGQIDEALAAGPLLPAVRELAVGLSHRRLPNANRHDPNVYSLLLPMLGDG